MMIDGGMSNLHGIWMLLMAVIIVVPFWRICVRIGYSGLWSLLILLPIANILFLYFLAFAEWPSRRAAQEEHG